MPAFTSKEVEAFERRPGGSEGLSVVDKKLLALAAQGRSPDELSAETGVPPERAAQRVREILKTRDWLSTVEKRRLLMEDFYELRAYILEMMEADKNPNEQYDIKGRPFVPPSDPRWSQNMLQLLRQLRDMIDKDEKSSIRDSESIREGHAKLMIRAISVAFNRMVMDLTSEYPEIDPQRAFDLMEQALPGAMETVEAKVTI